MTSTLKIAGMHCASCKMLIEEVCRETHGVAACDVDFEKGAAVIEHDGTLDTDILIKEISGLGQYTVEKV